MDEIVIEMMRDEAEFYVPPDHVCAQKIADAPAWLRDYFRREKRKPISINEQGGK